QLAAQLTVSRQAVSKWELDETMPDTENVIQLSRLFGVTCDYLLREEVDEPGAPQPAPGETHLDQRGWIHNATVLSLTVCAMGLLMAVGGALYSVSPVPTVIALIVQLAGILIFELSVPRMGGGKAAARLTFYASASWLVLFIPLPLLTRAFFAMIGWSQRPRRLFLFCVLLYVLICGSVTAALVVIRRRQKGQAPEFRQKAD
ncbi:MAG: helix-turn-helix domain-containing protein, partial [Oscillospiraceae bacterium]|nr:helix-turn-helix domain-containing protein [Oscillospiraceae bacterium]